MGRKKSTYNLKEIGRRIRQIRGFDMTQEEFAKLIGTTQTMVSKYEKGLSAPPIEVILRIAEVGNTTVDWILKGER